MGIVDAAPMQRWRASCLIEVRQVLNESAPIRTFLLSFAPVQSGGAGIAAVFDSEEQYGMEEAVTDIGIPLGLAKPTHSLRRTDVFTGIPRTGIYRSIERATLGGMPVNRRKCRAK